MLECGIARPTLRKWFKRYKEYGIEGLNELSRRPHKIHYKITIEDEHRILDLRINRNLGHRSIASEMKRLFESSYSTATVHKILNNNKQYLKLKCYYRKKYTRYNRPIPGDRIQMDVCKIAPGIYQYTAIDDCSRFKVLELFQRRTAINTLKFLETMIKQMPFAIQRIQTDRGKEFFGINHTLVDQGLNFKFWV